MATKKINGYYIKIEIINKLSESKAKIVNKCIDALYSLNDDSVPYYIAFNTLLREKILILGDIDFDDDENKEQDKTWDSKGL